MGSFSFVCFLFLQTCFNIWASNEKMCLFLKLDLHRPWQKKDFILIYLFTLLLYLCSEGILPEKRKGVRVSWCMRDEPSWVTVFFLFGSWCEVEKTQRDSEEGFLVPSECSSCRIENAFFLLLNWFKRELSFTLYFSCLAIQVYRVAAVCFSYSHGERSVWRSHPSFKVWRKN